MADYKYYIEYKDHNNVTTKVEWFKKGVTTALSSYEFTARAKPLQMNGFCDDRYTPVRGSEIDFSFVVQSSADQTELRKLLDDIWYVRVVKDSSNIWFGEVSQFYNEAYTHYPYVVTVNASDRLGYLNDVQPLLIDYNTPNDYQSLLSFIIDMIDFYDSTTYYAHAPAYLRVALSLYKDTEKRLLEEVFINPLVYMDTEDQYLTKREILDNLLTTLGAKLLQWDGVWYLLSLDFQEATLGQIDYRQYIISAGAVGATDSTETKLIDLFLNNTTRPVDNNLVLSFVPGSRGVIINEDYQQSQILDVYANRSGSNYNGESGTYLEFNAANSLQHWSETGTYEEHKVSTNDGWVRLPSTGWITDDWSNYKSKLITLPTSEFNQINIHVNSLIRAGGLDGSENTTFRLGFEIYCDGTTYYALRNTDGSYEWNSDGLFEYYLDLPIEQLGMDFNVILPRPDYDQTKNAELTVILYKAGTQFVEQVLVKNLRVQLLGVGWDTYDYSLINEGFKNTYTDNKLKNKEINLRWGIYYPDYDNSQAFHLSAPLDSSYDPIATFTHSHYLTLKTFGDWLGTMYLRDNMKVTRTLSGSIRSWALDPLTIVKDYEGYYYSMLDYSFDDETGTWDASFVELKGGAVAELLGDYSPSDYNNDYFTEYPYYDENKITEPFDFSDAVWTKTNTTITSDATTAPNTNQLADKLIETAATSYHRVTNAISGGVSASGEVYKFAIFAKKAERDVIQIFVAGTGWNSPTHYANFDLNSGALGDYDNCTPSITDYGSGWYLCEIEIESTGSGTATASYYIQDSTTASRAGSYAGDGTSGLYIWNSQLREKIES